MDDLRFIDMFAGVGGARLGLERAGGYTCVWANDIDRFAAAVYRHNFPGAVLSEGDIRGVDADSVPDFDLLCAGFPCQSHSTAGDRGGLADPRGALVYEVLRVAARKRPPLLLLENVPGLLSSDGGGALWTILGELGRLGYGCQWQVLNTYWWGPPQDRPRVYIVGHLGAERRPQVFPVGEDDLVPGAEGRGAPVESLAQSLRGRDYDNWRGNFILAPPLSNTLTGGGRGHGQGLHGNMTVVIDQFNGKTRADGLVNSVRGNMSSSGPAVAVSSTNPRYPGGERRMNMKPLSRALNAGSGNNAPMVMAPPLSGVVSAAGRSGENAVLIFEPGEDAPKNSTFEELIAAGYRPRRMTPRECERAHGYPDGWTAVGDFAKGRKGLSDTARYRLLGEAMSPPVVEYVGRRLRDAA